MIKFKPEVINEIGDNFVKAKGKLSRPARGSIITAYGQETAKGVSSKGIIIKTRAQAQVIAPFDGSVLFAGPFRGYGNLIIIEHGKGYTSLLAGLDSIDCELGQLLLAGEPIGLMPDDAMPSYIWNCGRTIIRLIRFRGLLISFKEWKICGKKHLF